MVTRTTGTTAAGTAPAEPGMAATSIPSPTADGGFLNTEPTQQDWLEIFLGLATQLGFSLVRLQIEGGNGKLIHAITLNNVLEHDGELLLMEGA